MHLLANRNARTISSYLYQIIALSQYQRVSEVNLDSLKVLVKSRSQAPGRVAQYRMRCRCYHSQLTDTSLVLNLALEVEGWLCFAKTRGLF